WEKLFILSYLDNAPGATIHETANKFQIETKQIQDWRNKREQLLLAQPHVKRLNAGAKPCYPNLEEELAKWVQALHAKLNPVSHHMIQTKAATLAKSTQYISQYPDINKFNNHRRMTIAQKLPEELEAQWQEFLNFV
ncbi:16877_t:CDS:2, partial [Dentiscutata erythropus]